MNLVISGDVTILHISVTLAMMFEGRSLHGTGNATPAPVLAKGEKKSLAWSLSTRAGREIVRWVVPKPFQPRLTIPREIQRIIWTAHDEFPVQRVAGIDSGIQEEVDDHHTRIQLLNYLFDALVYPHVC